MPLPVKVAGVHIPYRVWRDAARSLLSGPDRGKTTILKRLCRLDKDWRNRLRTWLEQHDRQALAADMDRLGVTAAAAGTTQPANLDQNVWNEVRRLEIERYGHSSIPPNSLPEPTDADLADVVNRLGDLCPEAATTGTKAERLFELRECVRGGQGQ